MCERDLSFRCIALVCVCVRERERERERERRVERETCPFGLPEHRSCVCVCERERQTDRERPVLPEHLQAQRPLQIGVCVCVSGRERWREGARRDGGSES